MKGTKCAMSWLVFVNFRGAFVKDNLLWFSKVPINNMHVSSAKSYSFFHNGSMVGLETEFRWLQISEKR